MNRRVFLVAASIVVNGRTQATSGGALQPGVVVQLVAPGSAADHADLALGVSAAGVEGNAVSGGVVVRQVGAHGAAERAGIRPGDILLAWLREANPPGNPAPAKGAIRSDFELTEAEIEQAPRGQVTLEGLRADHEKTASRAAPCSKWPLSARRKRTFLKPLWALSADSVISVF